MDADRADRVVYLTNLIDEFNAEYDREAGNNAYDRRYAELSD